MDNRLARYSKRITVGISVALNLLALTSLIWFVSGGMIVLAQDYIVKPHYARAVDQFDLLPVEPGETVFLGDSLTEFGNWPGLFPDTRLRNRGIAGDDTAGVLARLQEITAGRPAQVFLMIGTNDLTYGVDENQIVANVTKIVSRIHDDSPDAEVFVQSVLPRGRDFRERVESLNRKLQAAVSGRATWINLYPHFLDDDGSIADDYSNDELHLFGEGYVLWRDMIQQHVT